MHIDDAVRIFFHFHVTEKNLNHNNDNNHCGYTDHELNVKDASFFRKCIHFREKY